MSKMIKIEMPDSQWEKISKAQALVEEKLATVAYSNEYFEGENIYFTRDEIQAILDAFG